MWDVMPYSVYLHIDFSVKTSFFFYEYSMRVIKCCNCIVLPGCLGISRSRHSDVTHIYCKSQRTASHGNATGFPFIVRMPFSLQLHTGWAKNTLLFLKVCNSRICWHRIAFYVSDCSVFFIRSKTGVLYISIFKYSLCSFSVTTLH